MQVNTTHDHAYLGLLKELLDNSDKIQAERTGTGATNLFGRQLRFDLNKGFPLLTTKRVHFHSVVHELMWFLSGDTNIKYLLENKVRIWTEWRYKEYKAFVEEENKISPSTPLTQEEFEQKIISDPVFAELWGDIGKGYGHQWRNFGKDEPEEFEYFTSYGEERTYRNSREGFDQISWVINEIKTNPNSRRLIVTGWNPAELDQVDLPPCHTLFQFFVQDGKLSCQLYQRSADVFLGVPFNIASYALLTHMVAKECGLAVGEFVWTGGIVHLYSNHVEQAKEQLSRAPFKSPKLVIDNGVPFFAIKAENINIEGYEHHPTIKAEVAV